MRFEKVVKRKPGSLIEIRDIRELYDVKLG
jgi:hypothetical protein